MSLDRDLDDNRLGGDARKADRQAPTPGKHTNTESLETGMLGPSPGVPGKRSATEALALTEPPAYEATRVDSAARTLETGGEANHVTHSFGSGTPAASRNGLSGAVTSTLQSARGEPLANPSQWSQRVGGDVSDARVVTGEGSSAAAAAVGARAFTVGNRVFLGDNSPSTDGGDLLAHELKHVAQQRGAPAPSSWDQLPVVGYNDPREAEARGGSASVTPSEQAIARDALMHSAPEYINAISVQLATDLATHVESIELPATGLPYASWQGEGAKPFVRAVAAYLRKSTGWAAIKYTLSPTNPTDAIDRARGADDGKGPADYQPAVAEALRNLYAPILAKAVSRILPRYLESRNQQQLAAEEKSPTCPAPVVDANPSDIIASHWLDPLLAATLTTSNVSFDIEAYRKAKPEEAKRHVIAKLRDVSLQLLASEGLWMSVRVTAPAEAVKDGRPEEVAKALYGDSALGHLVSGSAPLFQFRVPPAGKLAPAYDKQWRDACLKHPSLAGGTNASGTAADPAKALAEGRDPNIDPAEEIIKSPYSDQAAQAEAAKLPPTGATPAQVAERIGLTCGIVDGMADDASTFGLTNQLAVFKTKLVERAKGCKADPAVAAKWDGQSKAQQDLIHTASTGLRQVADQARGMFICGTAKMPDMSAYINKPLKDVAVAFVSAATVSDLVDTGRAKVEAAQQMLRMYPAELLDAVLAHVRRLLQTAKGGFDYADSDTLKSLVETEQRLRAKGTKLRDTLLNNPTGATAIMTELEDEVEALETEATIIANISAFGQLMNQVNQLMLDAKFANTDRGKAIKDKLSTARGKWSQLNTKFRAAKGNAEALKAVRAELAQLQQDPAFQQSLNEVASYIDDESTKQMLIMVGALIGIAIVTWGVGAIVEVAGAAAGGVAFAEALTFTALSTAIFKKDPTLKEFVVELGLNFVMFRGIKAVGAAFKAVAAGAELSAGAKAAQFSIEYVITSANGLAIAEYEKLSKGGKHLSEGEVADLLVKNFVASAAFSIATRAGGNFLEHLKKLKRTQSLQRVDGLRQEAVKAAKTAEASKSPEQGKQAIAADRKAIEAEGKCLEELDAAAKNPAKAKELGIDNETAQELHKLQAENAEAASEREVAELMLKLEKVGPSDFAADEATYQSVKDKHGKAGGEVGPDVMSPETGLVTCEIRPKAKPANDNANPLGLRRIRIHKKNAQAANDNVWPDTADGNAAKRDWERLLKERPNWKGMGREDFLAEYEAGKRINFSTGKMNMPDGRPAPPTIEVEQGDKIAFDLIQEKSPGAKSFIELLEQMNFKNLRAAVDAYVASAKRTVEGIRHHLKEVYRPQILRWILDRERLMAAHPDARWNTSEEAAAFREHSQTDLMKTTAKLDNKEASRIEEMWWENPNVNPQMKEAQSQVAMVSGGEKRIADNLLHGEIIDVKGGASGYDWKQIDFFLNLLNKPVKLASGGTATPKKVRIAALNPDGVKNNAAQMRARLSKGLEVEIFNVLGKSKKISSSNAAELQGPALENWLNGTTP